jgi:hypothetical protein
MTPTSTPERPTLPKQLRRDSLWTFGLLGVSALLWSAGLPTQYLVLITGPAAMAFAVSALFNTRGVDAVVGIRVWLWIAIAMGGMILLGGLLAVVFREPQEQLQACLDRAITDTAQRECRAEYQKAVEDLLAKYPKYGSATTG